MAITAGKVVTTMNGDVPSYGLWLLAAVNASIFILFALSFFKPKTARDWRSLGAFSAFIVALFAEMYGFPLTLYLLAGWVGSNVPALDPLSHDAGHLWPALFGWSMNPHWSPFHLLSYVFIGSGFMLIASAWRVLHDAQKKGTLATTGPYARLRHPQYAGFALIMVGFFLQWPTLVTGLMLPVLLVMYWRLANIEEHEVEAIFGDEYRLYARKVPAFLPSPATLLRSSKI
jgi:protein-S-isoprenylcysteine O-methyltransferase Ste14